MQPTPEQIAVAAYHRWERRGYAHGHDRADWVAAEKDLVFGLNYRWAVRHALRPAPGATTPVVIGQGAAASPRRCRFCERAAPAAPFDGPAWALPPRVGNTALVAWDVCDDCQAQFDAQLATPFAAFADPLLGPEPALPDPAAGVPVAALKALVRMGLAILPAVELHHFDDTVEWVTNPDTDRDAALIRGLGCHVYLTPAPVPAPFASLARRSDDDAAFPYFLFFLGTGRVVFQTHLPFTPRDEDLDDEAEGPAAPVLSMTMGQGHTLRASDAVYLSVATPEPAGHVASGPRAAARI